MATVEQCEAALADLVSRLDEVDPGKWAQHAVNRTISCHISDLGVSYASRLSKNGVAPFTPTGDPKSAQVRLTVSASDLIDLAADRLSPTKAWVSGRLKIEASVLDLLRLRKVL
ncbi:SCP2 sterol-binding domain-containing protein [Actinocorallia sp. B10E7]|uniref:SCP2 sterol-binding domain-containing protein n=1 Tax=Actinocorallia sp. B10E7 TaxID=3153558 RepID=UPI00325E95FA